MRAPVWIAESDGVGHARALERSPRTACGAPAIDPRYAWPIAERCELCVAVTKRATEMTEARS